MVLSSCQDRTEYIKEVREVRWFVESGLSENLFCRHWIAGIKDVPSGRNHKICVRANYREGLVTFMPSSGYEKVACNDTFQSAT